jgi:hypothetical protein
VIVVAPDDQRTARELLRDPHLVDRILADFDRCGFVGERTNKLMAYLAAGWGRYTQAGPTWLLCS